MKVMNELGLAKQARFVEKEVTLTINGEKVGVKPNITLQQYMEANAMATVNTIVEHNGNIIVSNDYDRVVLKQNDVVEVLRFVGGG